MALRAPLISNPRAVKLLKIMSAAPQDGLTELDFLVTRLEFQTKITRSNGFVNQK